MQSLTFFRSRFFWKLYATCALLVLATIAVVGVLVHRQMAHSLLAEVTASLRDKTLLTEPYATRLFAGGIAADVKGEIERLGRETGIRITLIAPSGTVLVDSEEDAAVMDNHGDRPEVVVSRSGSFGITRRYSDTLQEQMLYVARTLREGETVIGTVRMAMPLRAIETRLASMRRTVALCAGLGVVLALLVGIVVARRVTAPIAEITMVADSMRHGRYGARVRAMGRDEIGLLGDTLNRLGAEITERIATISHDQAELQAMIGGMVEGVVAVDEQGGILHCNQAARQFLGIEDLAIRGSKLWKVGSMVPLVELAAEARSRPEPVRRELVVHHDSTEVVLDAHATVFRTTDAGGLVIVLHDISNLRRLEQIRRDFVANVSHEFKTPLTSIKGYVETLLSGALHDEQNNARFLEKIDTHVARLTDLVRDLLNLASVESREGTLPLAAAHWRPVIEGALQRHEAALGEKELTCAVIGECGPVLGEPEAMTQVVDNLLDNAIKFTPPHGSISLRLSRHETRGQLEIEDTGIGIPDEHHERVFERFYRVDRARSRELGGTGLGLSIVKHFVQAMKGQVHVESNVGTGSRFIVRLPLAT